MQKSWEHRYRFRAMLTTALCFSLSREPSLIAYDGVNGFSKESPRMKDMYRDHMKRPATPIRAIVTSLLASSFRSVH